jgi:hypothetical protein
MFSYYFHVFSLFFTLLTVKIDKFIIELDFLSNWQVCKNVLHCCQVSQKYLAPHSSNFTVLKSCFLIAKLAGVLECFTPLSSEPGIFSLHKKRSPEKIPTELEIFTLQSSELEIFKRQHK